MKTIEQLLELSKNPFYTFTPQEQAVLDDFLYKRRATRSQQSQETDSKQSSNKTRVRVRNIIPKTVDRVENAPEPTDVA